MDAVLQIWPALKEFVPRLKLCFLHVVWMHVQLQEKKFKTLNHLFDLQHDPTVAADTPRALETSFY